MRQLPTELIKLSANQVQCLTLGQLREHGFRSESVSQRVASGLWLRLTPRVVLIGPGPALRSHLIASAGLHFGDLVVTGRAALELLGVEDKRVGPIDLVGPNVGLRVPAGHNWRLLRTGGPIPRHPRLPYLAHPALATLHAVGRAVSDRQALAVVSMAANRGIVDPNSLPGFAAELPSSRFTTVIKHRVRLLIPGTESVQEWDFSRELRRRGLPEPVRQVPRRDSAGRRIYVDMEFEVDGRRIVVEVDGAQHFTAEHRLADQFRDNSLALQGVTVLRFSTLQLRLDPEPCFQQLAAALWRLRRGEIGA